MMTRTATAVRTCPKHPGGCRPEDREGHSFRARNDDWDNLEAAVEGGTAGDMTAFINETMTVRLGYVRCDRARCGAPVPVGWGNLAGHPLDWWIGEAVAAVRGQKCSAHEPVTIGAQAPVPAPRTAGTAVFQEPGGKPVVAAVPDRKKRRKP